MTTHSSLAVSQMRPVDMSQPALQIVWAEMMQQAANPRLPLLLEIRSAVQDCLIQGLRYRGFVHPPTYLFSTCVDPLCHSTEPAAFQYYGQECSLMQSLIFHKMSLIALSDIESVFWISPNVRKELHVSEHGRYATEFTQIDFESSRLCMESGMQLIEDLLIETLNTLAETHGESIRLLSGRTLKPICGPLPVFDLGEEMQRRGLSANAVEAALAYEIDTPAFLINIKREAYDRRDPLIGKYRNYDIIMPVTGEVLSGGEREYEATALEARMHELSYPLDYFAPVLRLAREKGFKPTAGAGFGVERLVRAICLLHDIAEIYPFRRRPGEPIIF